MCTIIMLKLLQIFGMFNMRYAEGVKEKNEMVVNIKQEIAQQIVEAVKDVCLHDINFIDAKGKIFASTNPRRIGEFHEVGRQVILSGKTIEVEEDGSFLGTQKGVNIPFAYKGHVSAVIGISGEPAEVRKYAYLAQKITTLLLREHELDQQEHYQKTQLNQVIRSLIYMEDVNLDYLTDFLKEFNATPNKEYQTIIVKLNSRYHPSNLSLIEKYIYCAFEQTESKLYTFNYSNEYILLLETEKVERYLSVFQNLAGKNAPLLKIGIGSAQPLVKQYKSYRAAQVALQSLMGEELLAIYDSLDLEILLGSISEDVKTMFLKQTIQVLSEKERELLKTYFACNMSLKRTSEQLYLHKNTLQYQLDRIWSESGYNPRKFKEAVVLYMGLKLGASNEV